MRILKLNGNDITKYVFSIPTIAETASDYGQISTLDMPQIVGNNLQRFWDTSNPASPFYGEIDLSKHLIEIIQDGITVFSGTIDTLQNDNAGKKANITLKSTIQTNLEKGLIYASAKKSNPAEMAREICSLYKIPYNSDSFNRSSNIYNDNNVVTTGFFKGEGTVIDGLQQIAEVGCARVYTAKNQLNFEVFETKEALPVVTFTDYFNNIGFFPLFGQISTQNIQKEVLNGYKIEWTGGFPATFGLEKDWGKTISATESSTVRIETLQSAVWIGEKWVEYSKTPQNIISLRCSSHIGRSLSLNYPIAVNYNGVTTILDINMIDNSNIVYTELQGQTR